MKTFAMLLALLIGCSTSFSQALVDAKSQTMHFDCRIQYKKEGDLSHRTVTLVYNKSKLIGVHIDAQPVYSFNVHSNHIVTSVDSERIQIEFAKDKTMWRSNFRDRDFGTGVCVRQAT
jgi:hypothetical protein